MLIAYIPLIVALVGLILWLATSPQSKFPRIGEHMFWTGLLVTLLSVANHVWRL